MIWISGAEQTKEGDRNAQRQKTQKEKRWQKRRF